MTSGEILSFVFPELYVCCPLSLWAGKVMVWSIYTYEKFHPLSGYFL